MLTSAKFINQIISLRTFEFVTISFPVRESKRVREREMAGRGCTFIVLSIFYDSAKGATNNIQRYRYNFNLIEKGNATTKAHRNFFVKSIFLILNEIRSFHSLFPQ